MALSYFATLLHSIAKREIKAFPIVQIAGPLQSRPQIHPIERAGWHYICGRSEITELHQQLQKHPIVFHPVGNAHRLFSIQYYKCYCVVERAALKL